MDTKLKVNRPFSIEAVDGSAQGDIAFQITRDFVLRTATYDHLRVRLPFYFKVDVVRARLLSRLEQPLGDTSPAEALSLIKTLHLRSLSHTRSPAPRLDKAFRDGFAALVIYARLIQSEAAAGSTDLLAPLLSNSVDLAIRYPCPGSAMLLLNMLPPCLGISCSDPSLESLRDCARFAVDALHVDPVSHSQLLRSVQTAYSEVRRYPFLIALLVRTVSD